MTVRSPIAGAIAGGCAGVAGVLVLALLVTTNSGTQDNTEALDLLRSCTIEPAGKCAELQQRQSSQFTRLIALAAVCTDRPGSQGLPVVERCIRRGMRRDSTGDEHRPHPHR